MDDTKADVWSAALFGPPVCTVRSYIFCANISPSRHAITLAGHTLWRRRLLSWYPISPRGFAGVSHASIFLKVTRHAVIKNCCKIDYAKLWTLNSLHAPAWCTKFPSPFSEYIIFCSYNKHIIIGHCACSSTYIAALSCSLLVLHRFPWYTVPFQTAWSKVHYKVRTGAGQDWSSFLLEVLWCSTGAG